MGEKCRGETREEALANIKEAIELVLEVQREELQRLLPPAREDRSRIGGRSMMLKCGAHYI